ncbi:MAG: EAL domain-containing protein [Zoogloeaceae bacterium]|jgi:diguanylate cyclase (GGDEF)-like protein/PAS domain S-box-containing protein|nr:EAL domain-containing protein [Zoogloeaceae bacterium]
MSFNEEVSFWNPDYRDERYSTIFAECPIPFALTRLSDNRFIEINKAFERAFGWSREEMLNKTGNEDGFWLSTTEHQAFNARLRQKNTVTAFPMEARCRDGSRYHCRLFATLLPYNGEEYIFTCVIDIGDQLMAEQEARFYFNRFQQLYEHMRDACALIGRDGRFLSCNSACCEMLGYSEQELQHLTVCDVTPAHWHAQDHRMESAQIPQRGWSDLYEKELLRKDGSTFLVEVQRYKNLDEAGEPDGFWSVARDISERKAQETSLNFLAYHDPLTRLPNRALLIDHLENALKRARRSILTPIHPQETQTRDLQLALLFLDIDHFKNVNDTLGHQAGDTLLQISAQNIARYLREADVLARFGGDEFVILLGFPVTVESTTQITRRLLSLFAEPVRLKNHEVYVTASIGVSFFPRDGLDADTLIRHADLAMFKAKEMGRNTACFYEVSMGASIQERMQLETALRGALQRGEFLLYYQPQIDLGTGMLTGVEALLYWNRPGIGLMPPSRFIPIAESIGIVSEIGFWALAEACRQMTLWRNAGLDMPRIAVNLSVQQLENKDFVEVVAQQLRDNKLLPDALELEVTESLLMHRSGQSLAVLEGLHTLGVQLSVDGFGTGYSSLAYLKTLPVHRLKIDDSFVRDIGRDSNSESIIRAIIALAKGLELETVAGGVEREEQEHFLLAEGCHVGQGPRYARPLLPESILEQFGSRRQPQESASRPFLKA